MAHRNVIRFDNVKGDDLVLISVGTMFPDAIEVGGERWVKAAMLPSLQADTSIRLYTPQGSARAQLLDRLKGGG